MTGIHKHFGSTRALQGVNLEVHEGEIHVLVGEKGFGGLVYFSWCGGYCTRTRGGTTKASLSACT